MLPIFVRFLKTTKTYGRFVNNIYDSDWNFNIKESSPDMYIADAFNWSKSPERESFWEGLDYAWEYVLDMYNDSYTPNQLIKLFIEAYQREVGEIGVIE